MRERKALFHFGRTGVAVEVYISGHIIRKQIHMRTLSPIISEYKIAYRMLEVQRDGRTRN